MQITELEISEYEIIDPIPVKIEKLDNGEYDGEITELELYTVDCWNEIEVREQLKTEIIHFYEYLNSLDEKKCWKGPLRHKEYINKHVRRKLKTAGREK